MDQPEEVQQPPPQTPATTTDLVDEFDPALPTPTEVGRARITIASTATPSAGEGLGCSRSRGDRSMNAGNGC